MGRDHNVRIAGNDYTVDPTVVGRFAYVHPGLATIEVICAGKTVPTHHRCAERVGRPSSTPPMSVPPRSCAALAMLGLRSCALAGPRLVPQSGYGP
jgi:hypothetical protein